MLDLRIPHHSRPPDSLTLIQVQNYIAIRRQTILLFNRGRLRRRVASNTGHTATAGLVQPVQQFASNQMENSYTPSLGGDVDVVGSNVIGTSQSQEQPAPTSQTATQSEIPTQSKMKRKQMKPRSKAWDHFVKIENPDGTVNKAICKYCGNVLSCNTSKNGTSSMVNHIKSCMKNPLNQELKQGLLNVQTDVGGVTELSTWKFDQDEIRAALVRMIIIDEFPFKCVEGEGFRDFVNKACPRFQIPSRWTVSRDCHQLFINEKLKLKSFLKTNCARVSITTDTWTSVQRINYMCITAHFIDNGWNLHKKIINFVPISSHKGDYLGRALENCLLDWGLKNVFTITVDNASSNDVAIKFLKRKISNWGTGVANGKYLHMRCIAHVVNLVVQDGLKDIDSSVKRVRDAIRYIRSSPARLKRFKECVELEGVESKSSLCLDVPTRWNSTYTMLSTAEKFERAFDKYDELDSSYRLDLGELEVPCASDWSYVRKYADLLKYFHKLTVRISGSFYVTSNTFLCEISDLCCILNDWKDIMDCETKRLGDSMKKKFDKYWGDAEKMNKIIFWASVFDPREKLGYMEYSLDEMYGGGEKSKGIFQNIKDELFEVYNEYDCLNQPMREGNASKSCSSNVSSYDIDDEIGDSVSKARYKKRCIDSGMEGSKESELEVYLSEKTLNGKLDVLKWWNVNSNRFPILSKMARDILAVPISTVASESAFSTSGRILDIFRSSLTPKIVEGLVCAQDWLRNSRHSICVEEQIEELESHEKDLPTSAVGGGSSGGTGTSSIINIL